MPKYFQGNLELPFEKVCLISEQITAQRLGALFSSKDSLTICVSFNGFEESCLGYIFNIRKREGGFEVLNITMEIELIATTIDRLVDVIQHASGCRFVDEVHAAFQNCRNNIGASMTHIC